MLGLDGLDLQSEGNAEWGTKLMVKAIALLVMLLVSSALATDRGELLKALRTVESGTQSDGTVTPGDHGRAIGPLQIHKDYWQDSQYVGSPAAGILYSQCEWERYSKMVVKAIWKRYEPEIYRKTQLSSVDLRSLALRHHYGGGWDRKSDKDGYWVKVKHTLESQ